MIKRLFEIEVPEVYNGVVEIKAIAREAGFRSKVAVSATQPGIDPVGSCIGIRGNRIQSIVNELQGEKIDIVSWDEEPGTFITNALSPSEPVHVELLESDQTAIVVVPDRQLSLAIGKEGQNTRLAARLTGWRLDIKGMSEWEEIKEATQALNGSAEEPEVEAAKAVEEASTIVEETAVAVEPEPMAEETAIPEPIEAVVSEPEATLEEIDEDAILAALIQEEEEQEQEQEQEAVVESLSVEDLGSFTIDDVELSNEDEDADMDEDLPSFDGLPV